MKENTIGCVLNLTWNFSLFLTDIPASSIRFRITLQGRFGSGTGHGVRHSGHSISAAFFLAYKS